MSSTTQLDANQVIKKVFDPASGSLLMVPAYVDTTVLLNAVPAGVSVTSVAINVLAYKVTGMMVSWASLDHTDGSVQFQGSVDGTIYENVGSAVALSTASSQKGVSFIDEPYKYIQAVYSHGSNTVGTVTIKYIQRA